MELPPEARTGPEDPRKGECMILSLCICLKDIVQKGRDFPWPKPEHCPNCQGNRLWGHGFVEALLWLNISGGECVVTT